MTRESIAAPTAANAGNTAQLRNERLIAPHVVRRQTYDFIMSSYCPTSTARYWEQHVTRTIAETMRSFRLAQASIPVIQAQVALKLTLAGMAIPVVVTYPPQVILDYVQTKPARRRTSRIPVLR